MFKTINQRTKLTSHLITTGNHKLPDTTVLSQVITLFLVMLMGIICKKAGILTNELSQGISKFVLYVAMPLLILLSFQMEYSEEAIRNATHVLLLSLAIHAFAAIFAKVVYFRVKPDRRKILSFAAVHSNCGFMGFPVMESLFGAIGIFYCSIFNIGFKFFLWTYGVAIFKNERGFSGVYKAVFNPGIIAVLIGGVFFYNSVEYPVTIYRALDMIGSTATPLAMIVIGARIADSKLVAIFSDFSTYIAAFVRLIAMPGLLIVLLSNTNLVDNVVMAVCVLLTAMPIAANTSIFAERYNTCPEFASHCVVISTVLSIITIPLIATFLSGITL